MKMNTEMTEKMVDAYATCLYLAALTINSSRHYYLSVERCVSGFQVIDV